MTMKIKINLIAFITIKLYNNNYLRLWEILWYFLLRYYKNKVDQKPGWNINLLKWCLEEAQSNKLKPQDYMGGLVLDEMKIQVLCSPFRP